MAMIDADVLLHQLVALSKDEKPANRCDAWKVGYDSGLRDAMRIALIMKAVADMKKESEEYETD